jgi:D-alanyl-D-alanine carboxypeptidase
MRAQRVEVGRRWRIPGLRRIHLLFALLAFVLPSAGALANPVNASIVLDAATGRVLLESNADVLTYPASLTKMMTLYLAFEAMQKGTLKADQPLLVSANAASQAPTKLGLWAGETVTVDQAIRGMIIKSANDAAMVVAETLGGSESAFAQMMNVKARALGMTESYFRNPNGLPDPVQHTTARDMAKLAWALSRDFPQYYPYFSQTRFTFHGRTLMTHNRFVLRYPGADGLKTGYIRRSGFNLASSAVHNGRRLVGVVMGGASPSMRDAEMWALLDQGFGTATPKSQNNALLLAAAGTGATLVPTLRPEDVSQAEDDATIDTDGDGGIGAEGPQKAGPAAPVAAAPAPQVAAISPAPLPAPAVQAPAIEVPAAQASAAPAPPQAPAVTFAAVLAQLASRAESFAAPAAAAARPAVPTLRPTLVADGGDEVVVPLASGGNRLWGVQVGAYSHYEPARVAAEKAQANLSMDLREAQITVDEGESHGSKLYRARLLGLAQSEANDACRQLHARQLSCLVVQSRVSMAMSSGQ